MPWSFGIICPLADACLRGSRGRGAPLLTENTSDPKALWVTSGPLQQQAPGKSALSAFGAIVLLLSTGLNLRSQFFLRGHHQKLIVRLNGVGVN